MIAELNPVSVVGDLNVSAVRRDFPILRNCVNGRQLIWFDSYGPRNIGPGDEIVISWLEHHANLVPWQRLCAATGARLRVIPVDDKGQLDLDSCAAILGPKTKLVSFTHVSNALGTVTPAREIVRRAHAVGAKVLIDGAQAVSHMQTDVRAIGCDWYAFSGHKIFGPTGIGVLYGKEALLNEMEPWQASGNMIREVTFEYTRYNPAPARFEAGTANIAGAAGLAAAIDYLTHIGFRRIGDYENRLLAYLIRSLQPVPGLQLIGSADHRAGAVSFVIDGLDSAVIGAALNREGIAIRSGHHCAQPILRRFGVENTVRPSLAFYNTYEEVDIFLSVLTRLISNETAPSPRNS